MNKSINRCFICNTRFNLIRDCKHVICHECDNVCNMFGCCRLCKEDFNKEIGVQASMMSAVWNKFQNKV